jgi:ABC-type thiamine transport system ATPase subunit
MRSLNDPRQTAEGKPSKRPVLLEDKEIHNIFYHAPVAHNVILAIRETGVRRIEVQSQPRKIVLKTISQKTHHETELVGWWSGSTSKVPA